MTDTLIKYSVLCLQNI